MNTRYEFNMDVPPREAIRLLGWPVIELGRRP